jgi:hypothetical protein
MDTYKLRLQLEAFMHYIKEYEYKDLNLEECAAYIGLEPITLGYGEPSIKNAWAFLLMRIAEEHNFVNLDQIKLVHTYTKKIISIIQYPLDKFYNGQKFQDIFDFYTRYEYVLKKKSQKPNPNSTDIAFCLGKMLFELQLRIFMHYIEQCEKYNKEFNLEKCATDIGLKSYGQTMEDTWGFLLAYISENYNFDNLDQIKLAYKYTKKIISIIQYPLDKICEGQKFQDIFNNYERITRLKIISHDLGKNLLKSAYSSPEGTLE